MFDYTRNAETDENGQVTRETLLRTIDGTGDGYDDRWVDMPGTFMTKICRRALRGEEVTAELVLRELDRLVADEQWLIEEDDE